MAKKALAKKQAVKEEPAKKSPAKKDVAKQAKVKHAEVKQAEVKAATAIPAAAAKPATAKKASAKKTPAKNMAKKDTIKEVATLKEVEAAPSKKALPTLTTAEISDHLAATFDIPKSHAKIYLTEAIALIGKSLKKGSKVRISGLGVFQVKKRAARKGRNPNTGEPIKIKASKRVGFAVARDLKVKL